jgi:YD repeat-containing protein
VTSVTPPGAPPITTDCGRVASARDPRLHVTTYHYDALDQATSVELPAVALPAGAPPELTAGLGRGTQTSTYDRLGQRLTSTDRMGETTTFHYTARTVTTSRAPLSAETTSYYYDGRGHLTQRLDPDGVAHVWQYDPDGTGCSGTRA